MKIKTILIFSLLFFANLNAYAQDKSACINERKADLEKLENKLEKFKGLTKVDETIMADINKLYNEISPLSYQINVCSNKNRDSYDFTEMKTRYEKLKTDTRQVQRDLREIEDAQEEALRQAKYEAENRNYLLQSAYESATEIVLEEREYASLDDETYDFLTLENTAEFKQKAMDPSSNMHSAYEEFIEAEAKTNTTEYLNRLYEIFDYFYAKYDEEEAVRELTTAVELYRFLSTNVYAESDNLKKAVSYGEKLLAKKNAKAIAKLNAIAVNDFHKANPNKIFFTSNLNLKPELATAADYKTSFEAGEYIKGVAYLNDAFYNVFGKPNEPMLNIYGLPESTFRVDVEHFAVADGNRGFIEFYIIQSPAQYKAVPGRYSAVANTMREFAKLTPREHTIKVELVTYNETTPQSVGSFQFNADNEAGITKIEKESALIKDKHLADVPLPKAGMRNATYEKQITALYNSIGWEETFTKTIIESSSFGYKKNWEGVVIGRTLRCYLFSTKNGSCMYQEFTVIQDKVGSGWSEFKTLSTGSQTDISCSKVH